MKKCGAADTPSGGNAAHQGEGLETEAQTHREGALSIDLPGYLCDPTGARAELTLDAGTASYPRGVLRGERPKRVLVPFDRAKGTPSGKRPHQAGKPASGTIEEQDFVQQSGVAMVKARPSTRRQNVPPPMGYNRENPRVGALREKTIRYFQFPLFSRGGVWYTT